LGSPTVLENPTKDAIKDQKSMTDENIGSFLKVRGVKIMPVSAY